MNRTKILATIGPASENPKTLEAMIKAGLFAARLNFSHGSFEEHGARIINIRKIEKKLNRRVKIIQDLCGPKLRLGQFKEFTAKEGDKVVFGKGGLSVEKPIWEWVRSNQVILLDDGVIELVVTKAGKGFIETRVVVPGVIKPRKGVSLPGVKVDLPSLSEKDLSDLEFGIQQNLDGVAISFIKTAQDIKDLREHCKRLGKPDHFIIAKIETVEAVANIKSILKETDAIMIARGDLALNLDLELVPLHQKMITQLCHEYDVPVIVATQMLESMTNNPRPTRAEMSDVANAVLDSADAVMLSGETANGKYPVKTVEIMHRIIDVAEKAKIDWTKWMKAKQAAKKKSKSKVF
ncbi:MAG TPA: pyruvate kinase [Candidatus Binatia bacterium]|nr:pyruvate kinase [Candidatus Binatia bacterium]